MLACWVDDPDGDYFKKHLARLKEYIWIAEDGIKMHVITNVLQNNCRTFYLSIEYLNLSYVEPLVMILPKLNLFIELVIYR